MHGDQERNPQTVLWVRIKSPRNNPVVTLPFIELLNLHPARLHGLDGPNEGPRQAKCRLIPFGKEWWRKRSTRARSWGWSIPSTIGIRKKHEDKAFITVKMEAMMEQLRESSRGPILGASTTTTLNESIYNPAAFPPLPQLLNLRQYDGSPERYVVEGQGSTIPVSGICIRKCSCKYLWSPCTTQHASGSNNVSF